MNGFQKEICSAFTLTFAVLGLGLSAAGYAADEENQALFDKAHRVYNQLLEDNVKNSMVNYAALVEAHDGSLPILAAYLDSLAAVAQDDFETWEVSELLAVLQGYWPEEVQAQLRQHNLKAIDINCTQYDWSLNEMNNASLSKR
jgi:hypothetical protein